MARCSSSNSGGIRKRLSSCAEYLEAIAELRTKLLHSSPSYLVSHPEELISLVEVAKRTLQRNGVSLHTFSSCPDHLSAYKAAYFGLLLQLQAHSHHARLDSKDLQARLNRLLFPLFTQIKVRRKAEKLAEPIGYATRLSRVYSLCSKTAYDPADTEAVPLSSESHGFPATNRSAGFPNIRSTTPPILPSNVMLPPPVPLKRSSPSSKTAQSLATIPSGPFAANSAERSPKPLRRGNSWLVNGRKASNDTLHFKRRHGEPPAFSGVRSSVAQQGTFYNAPDGSKSRTDLNIRDGDEDDVLSDEADTSDPSSGDDDDNESDSPHIVIPPQSPLRRSFGIFCTGRGRGAFSGSVRPQRPRSQRSYLNVRRSLRREPKEDSLDIVE